MTSGAARPSARYWWVVLLAALTFAASWLIGLIAVGSWLLFDRPEPLDNLIVALWGVLLPGWVTANVIWGIAIRRTDPARSERHFLLTLLALPVLAIAYAIMNGWIAVP